MEYGTTFEGDFEVAAWCVGRVIDASDMNSTFSDRGTTLDSENLLMQIAAGRLLYTRTKCIGYHPSPVAGLHDDAQENAQCLFKS